MKLTAIRWLLVVTLAALCLVTFWAVSSANPVTVEEAPAAGSDSALVEEEFTLTVDEQGARSRWRSGPENGEFHLDLDDKGLRIRGSGLAQPETDEEVTNACTCDCNCKR